MASKCSFVFILFALICLSAFSFATPIKDVPSTTVAISESKTSNSEHFAVAVQRVDDLVDDSGELLAERIDVVIIDFDLKDNQLLVNNVPVELGISSVQVIEAQIVPGVTSAEQLKEYSDNFDIGLVTVQVSSAAESIPAEEDGVTLRRISITIHIIEIDGVNVNQSQGAVEKILEFKVIEIADGDKDVIVPFYPDEDLSSHDHVQNEGEKQHKEDKTNGYISKVKCAFRSFAARVRHWWRCSSRFTRIVLVSFLLTTLFGVIFMAIPSAIRASITHVRRRSSPYSAIALYDYDETVVEQVIFIADEEKRALMEQEKELNNK